MLADPLQAAVSQVVLLEYLRVPETHELAVVLPEPTRGQLPNEFGGIWEIGVGTHDDVGVPIGVDAV